MADKIRKTNKVLKAEAFRKVSDSSKSFYLCDGRKIESIAELITLLDDMDASVFSYHVTGEKNDFANWLRDVFGESKIAEKVAKAKDKKAMKRSIFPHMTT